MHGQTTRHNEALGGTNWRRGANLQPFNAVHVVDSYGHSIHYSQNQIPKTKMESKLDYRQLRLQLSAGVSCDVCLVLDSHLPS